MADIVFGVSDFIAIFNQTLEYAYPTVTIVGELSDFRVSKNRWVYFDLKDDTSSVKFFGTVYQLPGPLEDGLMLEVTGQPRLHHLYGFSINIQSIRPVGEGSIKKASALLEAKLTKEGLFDTERKRSLPYPPKKIGLITAAGSAAYHDFVKIIGERWSGLEILHIDTQVQGEAALQQLVDAVQHFNTHEAVDVLVITRGGGSLDDLAVFNAEPVVRAVAGSRSPTLVAIGHEVDVSLAELAADVRASTPTNAAQVLVPDANAEQRHVDAAAEQLFGSLQNVLTQEKRNLSEIKIHLLNSLSHVNDRAKARLVLQNELLAALSPSAALKRGFAIVKRGEVFITRASQLKQGESITLTMQDGEVSASISSNTG